MEFCAATTDEPGRAWKTKARAPETWGHAIDVPDRVLNVLSAKWEADATLVPGATTSGLTEFPGPGPTEENVDKVLVLVIDPTPKANAASPGEPAVEQAVPEFPMAKTPAIPAFLHAVRIGLNHVCPPPPPQLLETIRGALPHWAAPPAVLVGQAMKLPQPLRSN